MRGDDALLWRDIESIGRLAVVMPWRARYRRLGDHRGPLHLLSVDGLRLPPQAYAFDGSLATALGAASVLAMYSYGGYNQVCNIGEEITDPTRTVPRSIVISIFIVAALYMAMTIVVLGLIPWREAAELRTIASEFIVRTFADPPPAHRRHVMTGLILLSPRHRFTPPSWATRASRSRRPRRRFLRGVRECSTKHFPHVSLVVITLISLPFCFFSLGQLVSWLIQVQILLRFIWQCAAVILLRRYRRHPAAVHDVALPAPSAAVPGAWLYIFFTGPCEGILFSFGFLAVSAVAYFVFVRQGRSPSGPRPPAS